MYLSVVGFIVKSFATTASLWKKKKRKKKWLLLFSHLTISVLIYYESKVCLSINWF